MPVAVVSKLVVATFDLYMTYRQRKCFAPYHEPSPRVAELIPRTKFERAQAYGRAQSTFQLITGGINTILEACATIFYLPPALWMIAGKFSSKSELKQTLMFSMLLSVVSTLTELPASVYHTFVLEARFGFNKTRVSTFIMDLLKGLLLSAVIGLPMITLLFYVLNAVASYDAVVVASALWCVAAGLTVLMLYLFPVVIAPMFNTFTPMADGVVKTRVQQLAAQLKFPLDKIYVVDGSRRSKHSNAYIFGLFRKYICIFDTLLEQSRTAEDGVVAVVCHELGHWQYGHLGKGVAKALLYQFVVGLLYAVTAGNKDLFRSFGFTTGTPVIIGMILFNNMLSPLDDLMQPMHNWVSRKFEYEADAFAKQRDMAQPLGDALVRMSVENLSNMNPDPLYSMWNYSHPTLLERLDALNVFPKVALNLTDDQQSSVSTTIDNDSDTSESKKDQ